MNFFRHRPFSCGILHIHDLAPDGRFGGNGEPDEHYKNRLMNVYIRGCIQGNDHDRPIIFPMVIFSDNIINKWGRRAKRVLEDTGDIIKSRSVVNPNSGNTIELFTWFPSEEFRRIVATKINRREFYAV